MQPEKMITVTMFVCLFVCLFSCRYNPLWLYFHSPVAGFSLLVFSRFLDHAQRRATVCRTPLDEWSVRRRDLYLTTHNTHNRQTSMSPVGFEPTISAGERPQTYALDRAATLLLQYKPENLARGVLSFLARLIIETSVTDTVTLFRTLSIVWI